MSSYIVQFPGQGKLVMITFKSINELFTQKKNTSYKKKITHKIINKMFIHIRAVGLSTLVRLVKG